MTNPAVLRLHYQYLRSPPVTDTLVAPVTAPAADVAADPAPGRGIVLYDGQCPLCQRSIRLLKPLDWLGRVHFQDARDVGHLPPCDEPLVPKRLLEEMHLVTPDRRQAFAGFRAFRWLAWRLPVLFPVAPLLHLPGVLWAGNRVYLWVAKNRFNLVACADGVCALPGRKK